ncbi:hypothetical protein CHUAL_007903 [Chamberlinius hualienensis]
MGVIMDRNLRYHRLPSEESNQLPVSVEMAEEEATIHTDRQISGHSNGELSTDQNITESSSHSAGEAMAAAEVVQLPPPYSSVSESSSEETNAAELPKYDPTLPPSYSVATVLPTYEQVEQLKRQEVVQEIIPIDSETLERGENLLGTDFMFLCAFFVSFLFNWIGFLMLMCFCPTIAGRYGALAGFGLSLAKWTLIVKHSTELVSMDNNWLWWLILAFGVLICVRAVLQYLNVKREWHLLTRATQQRLMYFY